MVKKITTKARMKSTCPQNVAFRFIKFIIDELPEKHITLSFVAQARGYNREAAPCLRPNDRRECQQRFVMFTYHGTPSNSANTAQNNNKMKGKADINFSLSVFTCQPTTIAMLYGINRNRPYKTMKATMYKFSCRKSASGNAK
tara:strand:+ start:81 stop:509 length:429 start_codon:yes stop_codon:yes gene_type:complete